MEEIKITKLFVSYNNFGTKKKILSFLATKEIVYARLCIKWKPSFVFMDSDSLN